ncbi:MAG: hypothetical protein Ct9H300mP12_07480 [Acidimicrobiales bacterium]|nr:MAG: hypothetical protein Ct9H300mP12_07480 [Acidimicrobiales bacterium]
MDLTPASFESGGVDSTEVGAQLGVAIDSLDSSLPIERTVSDFTHLIVPLQNLSAMAAVAPDFDGFAKWCRRIGVDTVALIVTTWPKTTTTTAVGTCAQRWEPMKRRPPGRPTAPWPAG